jgi:DNA-binding transcriptional LysR family regulator
MPTLAADWDDLRLFLAVWRARSLSGAARRLGVDVSTVSRRLAALEARVELALFERTRTGLSPTRAAEALVGPVEAVELAAHDASRAFDALERAPVGEVRLSCLPGVAELVVMPLLGALTHQYPGLSVSLEASSAIAALTRSEADLAIRAVQTTTGELVSRKVLDAQWTLFGSTELVARLGRVDTLEAVPLLGWVESLASSPPAAWLNRATSRPPAIRTNSLGALVSGAQMGLGATLLPTPLGSRSPGLVPVRLAPAFVRHHPWPRVRLWLVTHRAMRSVPRVATVWDHLVRELARLDR